MQLLTLRYRGACKSTSTEVFIFIRSVYAIWLKVADEFLIDTLIVVALPFAIGTFVLAVACARWNLGLWLWEFCECLSCLCIDCVVCIKSINTPIQTWKGRNDFKVSVKASTIKNKAKSYRESYHQSSKSTFVVLFLTFMLVQRCRIKVVRNLRHSCSSAPSRQSIVPSHRL